MMKSAIALLLLALLALPAIAQDMNGSYAEMLGPDEVFPGNTYVYEFYVYNGSPDSEWTAEVVFRFPETFHISSAWYDDGGQGWSFDVVIDGDYDEYVHFVDNDGGYGEIYDGTGGLFYVELLITENTECGPYHVTWKQYGDDWGDAPHWIGGDLNAVLCPTAADDSSWSSVKSLY